MIKDYSFLIPANGVAKPRINGDYIAFVSSSASEQPMQIEAIHHGAGVADINIRVGDDLHSAAFDTVLIHNATASDIEVVLIIGDAVEFKAGAGKSTASILPAVGFQGLAPLNFASVGTQLITENLSRKSIDILADENNTGLIFVGSTDGLSGIPLSAGVPYTVATTSELNVYGDTIGDKLHLAEVL